MPPRLSRDLKRHLHDGLAIPAHPLALTESRRLDTRRQRALTRYYLAAGAGGVAVGVHTTQFEIRDKDVNLLGPVLRLAAREAARAEPSRPFLMIAGVCGPTEQALAEADLAAGLGYHLGLLSMGSLAQWSEAELIRRAEAVAEIIPIFGFYLQPSVGGRVLSYDFWRDFADIPGVMAIKLAPFNRYQTLDVVRAVCHSARRNDIALYTGNDDNIVADLLTSYVFEVDGRRVEKRIVGGLLGHWSVWTKRAVMLLEEIKQARDGRAERCAKLLEQGVAITDTNAAMFDAAHNFDGCIAGINEVLRRQGLLAGNWCLSPEEQLSPGQAQEIDRVHRQYPELNDDDFVKSHLEAWLSGP